MACDSFNTSEKSSTNVEVRRNLAAMNNITEENGIGHRYKNYYGPVFTV